MPVFVSRAGAKLEHALTALNITPTNKICADLGCSTGGFTDCLLQHGAAKVYAVDTGYGVLDWKLRKNPRVVVLERTNAMHVKLPEKIDLITIDVGWTRQKNILPNAAELLAAGGLVITLIKPHYEANPTQLKQGVLPDELVDPVVATVKQEIEQTGWQWIASTPSPIRGTGGNSEILATLRRAD
jgi:23S rRNA (cytidine1920-2'-O)/16S rRNA (cytidine1409-2'-O)-methyltransferase